VWFKDARLHVLLSRLHQVEHEALMLLMAAAEGLVVPGVVAAGLSDDEDYAILVTRPAGGTTIGDLQPAALTPELLVEVWRAVARFHAAGFVHGHLTADALMVTGDGGIGFRELHHGARSEDPARMAADRAELLADLAVLVGPGAAARSARQGLGTEALVAVLPVLQPGALSVPTRRRVHRDRHLLDELRTAAAAEAGTEAPELAKLYRITWPDVGMMVMSIVGIYLIATQIGSAEGLGAALADADLWWAVVAMVLAAMTAGTLAYSLTGAISVPLRFGPVVLLEMANQFMGLVGGTVAMTATTIRFGQKRGLPVAVAISAGLLVTFAGFVMQVIIIIASLLLIDDLPTRGSGNGNGLPGWVLPVVIGIVVLVGIAVIVPRIRARIAEKVRPQLSSVKENLLGLAAEPRNIARLFLGAFGTQVLYAVAFECSLVAFGVDLPLLTLLLINTVAALFGGLAPIPGGLGVIEATLVAGLTAFGVDPTTATAGMLTYRTASAYLPPVWGWFSLVWLRRREYL
jgi:uncharacterized membrane protein YbhN (UPF0104 family)